VSHRPKIVWSFLVALDSYSHMKHQNNFMPVPIIFYSWQSDLPVNSTRLVIKEAAKKALSQITQLRIFESPRLDEATQGQSGTPEISGTIYRKINSSAVFLADLSFIAECKTKNGRIKRLSNPNVLLELGYAAKAIGWDRIILVMNKHYGSPESLPFDLRNRRFPVTYKLGPKSEKREQEINSLSEKLQQSVASCLNAEYERVENALSKMCGHSRRLMFSYGIGSGFRVPYEKGVTVLGNLDMAISELIHLGLIQFDYSNSTNDSAYYWTYLGLECAKKLGVHSNSD